MHAAVKFAVAALIAANAGGAFATDNTVVRDFGTIALPFTAGSAIPTAP